jgi:hypothetical protein
MRPFTATAVAVFAFVALVHAHRILSGWEIVIGGFVVPVWWSIPGIIVPAGLAYMLWREAVR